MFANRVKNAVPSPTIAVATKAKEMKAQGIDVIDLSLGDPILDPTYDIPQEIKDAAYESIDKNKISYTASAGILPLREAIVKKLKEENDLDYDVSEISVANGAKQVIFNAFLATIEAGDEVILPCPAWVSYVDILKIFGGKEVIINAKIENNFKITPDELRSAITSKTKWFIMNSPNNPSGAVYSEQEIKALAEVLKEYPDILIMSDDIYEYLIYDDNLKFHNFVTVDKSFKDRTLIINGTAKSHGMTGWRIGYAACNKEFAKMLNILQSQSTSNACTVSQYATIAAIKNGNKCTQKFLPELKKRKEMMTQEFQKASLTISNPEGAFYIFTSIESIIGKKFNGTVIDSCTVFCKILLEEFKVATTSGIAFGAKNHFRISLGCSYDKLKIAAERIEKFISKLE